MFVTCTPNPSFDHTLHVSQLRRGDVHSAASGVVEMGGKGINVCRALAHAALPSTAIIPAAHADAQKVRALLRDVETKITLDVVTITQPMRTNTTITESDGTTTKINDQGPHTAPAEVEALVARVAKRLKRIRPPAWFVSSGSLQPGADVDLHATLVEMASSTGIRTAVDSSGPALRAAIHAAPDLVKPNVAELETVTGTKLATIGDVIDAAEHLLDLGARQVLVSLGAQGALFVSHDCTRHAQSEAVKVCNTVGAGDALMAGFIASDESLDESLQRAVAWGAAAVASTTTSFRPPLPRTLKTWCGAPRRHTNLASSE